jgi:HD-GYP domain-containing protein (c-di-GMP phosphodiesterase class II)
MVRFHIDEVTDDMVLGESIFLPTGELLLSAGYRIKKRYRDRLRELGYQDLMIQVEGTEAVVPETTVTAVTQREMLSSLGSSTKNLKGLFEHFKQQGHKSVEHAIHENRQHLAHFIMNTGIQAALEKFIEEIMGQPEVVVNLSAMQQSSESLITHAMNVTITSLCIGRKYRLSYEELKQLAVGAISYDIGLVALPREILDKGLPVSGAELEVFKQHTLFGYIMLSDNPAIPATSAAAALQHHEHQDGSGYPRGIKGENRPPLKDFTKQNMIHRFAEIIAVADYYDMLTTGRLTGGATVPVQRAIKELIKLGGTILNSEIVKTLTAIVPVFPVGARVRVAEAPTPQLVGYGGVVARDNPANIELPQIILFETKKHHHIAPILINMAKYDGFVLELIT